jgi:glutamate synthase domain-containing protein 1
MGYMGKTERQQVALGATLLRMLTALGRRGPDSTGVALHAPPTDGAYRFGFKPLIVAESEAYVAIATEEVALRAACGAEVDTWEWHFDKTDFATWKMAL